MAFEYQVISEDSPDAMTERVTALCREGWRPQGGIAPLMINPAWRMGQPVEWQFFMYQALVRERE